MFITKYLNNELNAAHVATQKLITCQMMSSLSTWVSTGRTFLRTIK